MLRTLLMLVALVVGFAFSTTAWAQTTGTIRVAVVDDPGLPIPGVSLSLSGESLIGGVQERSSDENGAALFVELPAGRYRLVASKGGFGGVTLEGIVVIIGRETKQTVEMVPGTHRPT